MLHQWLVYRHLAREELEQCLGPAKENASDGDSRRRKLHLGQSSDFSEEPRFKPIPFDEGFLFSAAIRDDGEICNYSDQDYIHNHKKLDRHLDHQARTLYMGQYPVHRNFLRQVLTVFDAHTHGLREEDVNKRDVQNWASCQRTAFPRVRQCLLDLIDGNNVPQANNLALGLWAFLDIVYHYMEIFVSLKASLTDRIEYASYVVNFLGIWRNHIILSQDYTLRENFLSRETFQDVLISCHFAVMLILDFADNYPYLDCCLERTGSDGCEVFFSMNGSWVKNHHAYTILDMIRNHSAMTRIAEIRSKNKRLVFRKSHSKQDNIWEKQYPAGEIEKSCDLKDYPSHQEALIAWRRGARRAQDLARRVRIEPDLPQDPDDGDDHDSDGGDDNNDYDSSDSDDNDSDKGESSGGSNSSTFCENNKDKEDWFYFPFKGTDYKQLFHGMISETNLEEQEQEFLRSQGSGSIAGGDRVEDVVSEQEVNGLVFAESQRLLNNLFSLQENSESTDEVEPINKHVADISIPSLSIRKSNSSVVRDLIKAW